MKSVCLVFQIHQPLRHRRYQFFDIGNDNYYYDDYANETALKKVAELCYLPANNMLLSLAARFKDKFKVAFSISGTALEQFLIYEPSVIKSFQKLAKTGCVEFVTTTYSHSLASLKDKAVFENQVRMNEQQINDLFGQKPKVFGNTEMIYSDEIGAHAFKMGYKGILTEGARHVLGWKSPDFIYVNALNPKLKVLMRNFKLSDDISYKFSNSDWSEYPLTAEKFTGWLNKLDSREELVNLFLSYETFGIRQSAGTGIFDFFQQLVNSIVNSEALRFASPSELIENVQPVSVVKVPNPISWADEERDITAWLGNDMQREAFDKLYSLNKKMNVCTNEKLFKDWNFLQMSDHLYHMSTKLFSGGEGNSYTNPFDSPYEAFINYMNILNDFKIRLDSVSPATKKEQELATLHRLIDEKDQKIKKLEAELTRYQSEIQLKKTKKTRLRN